MHAERAPDLEPKGEISQAQYGGALIEFPKLLSELPERIRQARINPRANSLLYEVTTNPGGGRAIEHLFSASRIRLASGQETNLVSVAAFNPQTQKVVIRLTKTVRDTIANEGMAGVAYPEKLVDQERTEFSLEGLVRAMRKVDDQSVFAGCRNQKGEEVFIVAGALEAREESDVVEVFSEHTNVKLGEAKPSRVGEKWEATLGQFEETILIRIRKGTERLVYRFDPSRVKGIAKEGELVGVIASPLTEVEPCQT